MKRKDYQDKYDDFSSIYLSSPSAKSRRLDPDLLPFTNEDPISSGVVCESEVVEPLTSSTTNDLGLVPSTTSSSSGDNEKALVVYNPTNTPLFRSPTSPDFSVVVNSNLIPGLKDRFILLRNSNMGKPSTDAKAKDKITVVSDDRLAVIPWIAARAEAQATGGRSGTMEEAKDVEMMDADDNSGGVAATADTPVEEAEGLQQWQQQQQQHCMRPELFQSTYASVTW